MKTAHRRFILNGEDVSIEIKTGSYRKYDLSAIAVYGPVREI